MKYSQITVLPNQVEFHTAAEGDLAAKEFNLFDLNNLITALDKLSSPILTINHGEPLSEDNLFFTDLVIHEVLRVIPHTRIYVYTHLNPEELKSLEGNNHYKEISSNSLILPYEIKEK